MTRNLYQVLGVSRQATHAEIRAAYIQLARRHHPDSNHQSVNLPRRLPDIQHAYRSLSCPDERALYDRQLDAEEHRHYARQRAIQRRLSRFDQPASRPLFDKRAGWPRWKLALALCGVLALAAQLSATLAR